MTKRALVEWALVYAAMKPRLERIAHAVLRDQHAAEDVVQDAFLTAWCRIESLRDPRAIEGWLVCVVRNRAITRLRYRRVRVAGDDLREVRDASAPDAELRAALTSTLTRLPPSLRRAVELHLGGASLADAAQAEGISYSAARTRLCRARGRLRAALS